MEGNGVRMSVVLLGVGIFGGMYQLEAGLEVGVHRLATVELPRMMEMTLEFQASDIVSCKDNALERRQKNTWPGFGC